ncbi:hypothetical protein B0H63DRAFT_172611 [Podospora didyma]|uniref:Uncharacterized protein n=1 Tax=Podospora didyma TaxID=330526 RepID=A0AAE0NNM7_9PEZI|nr:hypothetical protein B0H63DRAFT_172611 [Podospora didyma]
MAENPLGITCPTGSQFYTCQGSTTEFVGCCTTDPCRGGSGCPAADVRPASFPSERYNDILPQACGRLGSSTALWYVCSASKPTFLGCCTTNACSAGSCPSNNLAPARLSSDLKAREAFLSSTSSTTSSRTTAASATSTPTTTSSTSTPTAGASMGGGSTDSSGLPNGAIAGIAIAAAIVVVGILSFGMYRWYAKRRASSRRVSFAADSNPGSGDAPVVVNPLLNSRPPSYMPAYASPSLVPLQGSSPPMQHSTSPFHPHPGLTSPPLSYKSGSTRDSIKYRPYNTNNHHSRGVSEVSNMTMQPVAELESSPSIPDIYGSYTVPLNAASPAELPAPPPPVTPVPSPGPRHDSGVLPAWGVTNNELHIWSGSEIQQAPGRPRDNGP